MLKGRRIPFDLSSTETLLYDANRARCFGFEAHNWREIAQLSHCVHRRSLMERAKMRTFCICRLSSYLGDWKALRHCPYFLCNSVFLCCFRKHWITTIPRSVFSGTLCAMLTTKVSRRFKVVVSILFRSHWNDEASEVAMQVWNVIGRNCMVKWG